LARSSLASGSGSAKHDSIISLFLFLVSLTKLTLESENVKGGENRMNRKVLVIAVALMAVAMLVTPLVGTVAANRGQNKKEFKSYTMECILIHGVTTNEEFIDSWYVADGTRAPDGVVEMVATIDGNKYSYPDDFSYTEYWHLELNMDTGTGALTVKAAMIFNLPGKPTVTEWIVAAATTSEAGTEFHGVFQLTGTKMFNKVEGGGTDDEIPGLYNGENALFVNDMGLITGWPFGK
jgi:hypothetical protein